MLRQRKAKDPILPLHNNNAAIGSPEEPSKAERGAASRTLTPPPPKQRKKKTDYARYRIVILMLLLVILGIAYLVLGSNGGGDGDAAPSAFSRHHKDKLMEIMSKRHYHQHTAGKLKSDDSSSITGAAAHDKVQAKNVAEAVTVVAENPSQQEPISRIKDVTNTANLAVALSGTKIRCLDGVGDGYLNDDYCDCSDGSDESKTSACSHLTVSQSKFHCNDGTAIIYSSRVKDGVKDCLDGSDERVS